VSDDQRPDTIAALGNDAIDTPRLDQLVRSGTAFTRATCAYPLCVPSRAELLSGRTVFHNGIYGGNRLGRDVTTWPATFRRAGYHTWYVGKWHTTGRPLQVGYEAVDGLFAAGPAPTPPQRDRHGREVTGYRGWQFQTDDGRLMPEKGIGLTPNVSAELADAAIRFIERRPDRPFLLHVNFTAPHDPLFLPPGLESKYSPGRMALPVNFLPEHPFDHGNLRGRDELLLAFPRTPADVRDELAVYYAVISHLDLQIGRVLDALQRTGQDGHTLVIFTSDHGLAIGSHGLRGKQNMYEHTIGVPLVFWGPGIARGAKRSAQCYLRDLFPTVCDLVGVPIPGDIDGRSLAGVLAGRAESAHPFVVGYFQDSQRMIRTDRWKLIRYPRIGREQLFDLANDRHEMHDVATNPAHAATLAELRQRLEQWLAEQGDPLAGEVKKDR
jgi:arylsulfatase A-like enzyme